jgi:mitochondrial fission protein ELM1
LFDLVSTTPQYRLPVRSNVVHNALPLHGISPERLATAGREWEAEFASLPKPMIAVLVGGRSGPYVFGPDAAARLARQASDRARSLGGSLLVTTSPRTSRAAAQALFDGLTVPAFCHRWQADQVVNPLQAYLAVASEVIVTADSISMIAEACASGKPTYLFDIETDKRAMRARQFSDRQESERPYLHWRGTDLVSTLWRLGLMFGPDWWTRDIRIVHSALVGSGRAAWFGDAAPHAVTAGPAQDMDRAIVKIKNLLGMA